MLLLRIYNFANSFMFEMLFLLACFFLFFFLFVSFFLPGCGSPGNDSLKSPGYPNSYPKNMECVYTVPIPYGMALNISFTDVDVGSSFLGYW